MRTRSAGIVAVIACCLAHDAAGQGLTVGDAAPDIGADARWLQGEPVAVFEPGRVYVLDFWATWCGPCIQTIPELDQLHRELADEGGAVLGLALWPRAGMTATDAFVRDWAGRMTYPIGEDIGGRLAARFMEAAGRNSIPTTMVVDREGRLAWIGHPLDRDLRPALRAILDAEYDIEAAAARAAALRRAQEAIGEANELARRGRWDEAFTLMDEAIAIDPERYARYRVVKVQRLLLTLRRLDDGYALARELVAGPLKDKPELLENLARFIAEAPGLERRELDIALAAAERSVSLTEERDADCLATLAHVLFLRGEAGEAARLQRAAVRIAGETGSPLLETFQRRRAEYEAAAEHEAGKVR